MKSEQYKSVVIKSFIGPIKLKFDTTSSQLMNFIKSERSGHKKSRRKYESLQLLEKFTNRLEKIATFIENHEEYVNKYREIYRSDDSDWRDWLQTVNFAKVEQLAIAYNVIDNADVFDLSSQGARILDDIIQSYNRMIENIFKDTITVDLLS